MLFFLLSYLVVKNVFSDFFNFDSFNWGWRRVWAHWTILLRYVWRAALPKWREVCKVAFAQRRSRRVVALRGLRFVCVAHRGSVRAESDCRRRRSPFDRCEACQERIKSSDFCQILGFAFASISYLMYFILKCNFGSVLNFEVKSILK